MTLTNYIPDQAATSLNDMLETCAELKPGEHVLISAHVDGLYGGPNLVDEQAVSWMQAAVKLHGARASVLWIDEPMKPHAWHMPKVLKAALAGVNVFINNSFDLTTEEVLELRDALLENNVRMVRNFATTAPLLASEWARTPHELVSAIRIRAGALFEEGLPSSVDHPNGTHLEGTIAGAKRMGYTQPRQEARPFPEWVFPPITLLKARGTLVFDRTLSWWSRYIGVSPFFAEPVRLTISEGRLTAIEGGTEAEALKRFLKDLAGRFGDDVYEVPALHAGVHPNAAIEPHQCPDVARRRWVEHSHTSNIHVHLGNIRHRPDWPYMLHITADIRAATWKVGNKLVHDKGHLTVLDDSEIREIASRYPDRPGLNVSR